MASKPILTTTNNLTFAPNEEVKFDDKSEANFGEISIRSLRLRPQRSQAGELWCVVTATFIVDNVIASKGDEVHPLCDEDNPYGKAYQNETIKRLETERWIPWNRVPSLRPLFLQLQEANYEIEAIEENYEDVKTWFEKNPEDTTMSPESTWMEFSVARNSEPLPASFVASVGDMQEATTSSVYDGLSQIKTLIDEFTKAVNAGKADREMRSNFRALVGNVMGYHTTNDGDAWGNKMALVAVTIDGEEYSLFFDRNRQRVTNVDDKFASVASDDSAVTETESGVDIAALLSGTDEE